jgi:hypothetical protein
MPFDTVAFRVKRNTRRAAVECRRRLRVLYDVEMESQMQTPVTRQPVSHRYMLRSMRR